MEKNMPHCKLAFVKARIASGEARITRSALASGDAIGFDAEAILAVVMALQSQDFYKSMTSHNDHHV